METKPLGKSGVALPEIGLGTWEFSGDAAVIHRAIELGSFLLDTAESYGTEGRVGRAIAGRRDDVFLATKVSPEHFHHADVLAACDRSLAALGVETIDLYQLHAPSADVPIEETMGAMADLVAAGKVRHVGVSNFSVSEMEAAEAALGEDLIVENQIKYSLFDHQFADTVIPYCEERGIMVLAYSSLEQGAFEQEMRGNAAARRGDAERLRRDRQDRRAGAAELDTPLARRHHHPQDQHPLARRRELRRGRLAAYRRPMACAHRRSRRDALRLLVALA